MSTYPDLVVVTLVLYVIIKLFLWVKLSPVHFQLLPNLQHQRRQFKQLGEAVGSELLTDENICDQMSSLSCETDVTAAVMITLTRCLNSCLSSTVIVSAFAITGMMFTE